ncbi:hypothetical protein G6F37_006163 [Rhizopus arrhizus]|nr:hypothetical protein G6F38_006215 [Rhizopus arrhizus]KAG1158035.1 hypothetical protein G6F37_006163 [Rhizopus arrhizus]
MPETQRRVLIALDETGSGKQVLDWIHSHHILAPEDEITVATAVDEDVSHVEGPGMQSAPMSSTTNATEDFATDLRMLERHGKQHLSNGIQTLQQLGYNNTKPELLKGHPGRMITKYAKDQQMDLVVCGRRHNRGVLKRSLMGSVSEYLVHNLDCPILIVQ